MKLASLKEDGRDGALVVVNFELTHAIVVPEIAPTMQFAIENWQEIFPELESIYFDLNEKKITGFPIKKQRLASPFPRSFQWLDGSAYLSHVERVRKARGAEMPENLYTDPLMYQGGSDSFLGPADPIELQDLGWGLDFEAEVVVVTDDVPQGITADEAINHIRLIMLVNDLSLRNLIPAELAKGFGFLHGKPPSAFSPVAVTIDELGNAWSDGKLCLPLTIHLNGQLFGNANAGIDMHFNFSTLISHAAKTRALNAGTLIGSGTVSNHDASQGFSCLVEKRVNEIIEKGEAETPFLTYDDQICIEMFDHRGDSIFGSIEQKVVRNST